MCTISKLPYYSSLISKSLNALSICKAPVDQQVRRLVCFSRSNTSVFKYTLQNWHIHHCQVSVLCFAAVCRGQCRSRSVIPASRLLLTRGVLHQDVTTDTSQQTKLLPHSVLNHSRLFMLVALLVLEPL